MNGARRDTGVNDRCKVQVSKEAGGSTLSCCKMFLGMNATTQQEGWPPSLEALLTSNYLDFRII